MILFFNFLIKTVDAMGDAEISLGDEL